MKFNEEFIERVRDASDLVEVVSQYVTLKKSGSGYQGLCPFHGEKTPSFSVSDIKQVYHCFGCKTSGNVFKFVQDYQGLTFPEAVEYLAGRAGIPLPQEDEKWGGAERQEEKKLLFRINGFAAEFYHQRLMRLERTHEVWRYLEARGLTENDVKTYKLGWASANWSDLSDALLKKKAPLELAEKVGLSKKRGNSPGYFDLFRSRLMFPIFSPTEKCLGFGGRVIGDEHPKYLNSPDSEIFHKGQVFYGLNWSAKHIRTEDQAIIVEGYMDWIALDRQGISNAVATLGTALTDRHAKILKRYTPNAVVLFDGDSAGRSAAERSLPILLKEGLYVKGLFLPDKMDPDDYLKAHGVENLREQISKSSDLFDILLEEEVRQTGGASSDKTKLIDKMVPVLEATENPSLRELYIESLAYILNVDKAVIPVERPSSSRNQPNWRSRTHGRNTASRSSNAGRPARSRPENPHSEVISLKNASRAEIDLLNVSLLKSVYLEEVLNSQVREWFESEGIKMVFERVERLYRQDPSKFDSLSSLLLSKVEPGESVTLHLTAPFQALTDEAAGKVIQDCIKRIREKFLRSQSRALLNNLKGSQGLEQREKLEQLMNIQRHRQDIKDQSKIANKQDETPSYQEPDANE